MADCNETLRELYLFLDGQLTEADVAHIRQHLEECSPCWAAYDFEAELREVIRHRCTDSVPDALRARIASAIEREGRPEPGTP